MDKMMKSRSFKIASLVVAFVLVALLGFAGGMKIGARKALFSCRWGENYAKNFMDPHVSMGRPGFFGSAMRNPEGNDFRNAHGMAGSIISVSGDKIVVKDNSGKENTVAITNRTIIKNHGSDLSANDLKIGEKVVIMGRPNVDGTISADLIRVFNVLPPSVSQQPQSVQSDSSSPVSNNNQ